MSRGKRVRVVTGSLLMVGFIATGAGIVSPGAGGAPAPSAVHWAGPNRGYGTATSLNWAGYAVTKAVFTKVTGSWTQPKATCPKKGAELAAFWIGIDGFSPSDPTVQQVGTDSDCKKGAGSYYAWYQMYPKAAVFLSTSKYPVVPGETIAARVSAAAKTFTLQISATSGGTLKWHFSTAVKVKTLPLESSAEWITEAPCIGKSPCTVAPLSDFGSVNFSAASANGRAISAAAFTATQLTMTNEGSTIVKAHPSALTPAGTGFNVTWLHA
ncbi:MAG: G1 family glutamic endopeptidase [Acidimicrobiales bacterium]